MPQTSGPPIRRVSAAELDPSSFNAWMSLDSRRPGDRRQASASAHASDDAGAISFLDRVLLGTFNQRSHHQGSAAGGRRRGGGGERDGEQQLRSNRRDEESTFCGISTGSWEKVGSFGSTRSKSNAYTAPMRRSQDVSSPARDPLSAAAPQERGAQPPTATATETETVKQTAPAAAAPAVPAAPEASRLPGSTAPNRMDANNVPSSRHVTPAGPSMTVIEFRSPQKSLPEQNEESSPFCSPSGNTRRRRGTLLAKNKPNFDEGDAPSNASLTQKLPLKSHAPALGRAGGTPASRPLQFSPPNPSSTTPPSRPSRSNSRPSSPARPHPPSTSTPPHPPERTSSPMRGRAPSPSYSSSIERRGGSPMRPPRSRGASPLPSARRMEDRQQQQQQQQHREIAGDEPRYASSGASSHRSNAQKGDDDFRGSLEAMFSSSSSSRSAASRQLPADHSSPWIPRTHGLRRIIGEIGIEVPVDEAEAKGSPVSRGSPPDKPIVLL